MTAGGLATTKLIILFTNYDPTVVSTLIRGPDLGNKLSGAGALRNDFIERPPSTAEPVTFCSSPGIQAGYVNQLMKSRMDLK